MSRTQQVILKAISECPKAFDLSTIAGLTRFESTTVERTIKEAVATLREKKNNEGIVKIRKCFPGLIDAEILTFLVTQTRQGHSRLTGGRSKITKTEEEEGKDSKTPRVKIQNQSHLESIPKSKAQSKKSSIPKEVSFGKRNADVEESFSEDELLKKKLTLEEHRKLFGSSATPAAVNNQVEEKVKGHKQPQLSLSSSEATRCNTISFCQAPLQECRTLVSNYESATFEDTIGTGTGEEVPIRKEGSLKSGYELHLGDNCILGKPNSVAPSNESEALGKLRSQLREEMENFKKQENTRIENELVKLKELQEQFKDIFSTQQQKEVTQLKEELKKREDENSSLKEELKEARQINKELVEEDMRVREEVRKLNEARIMLTSSNKRLSERNSALKKSYTETHEKNGDLLMAKQALEHQVRQQARELEKKEARGKELEEAIAEYRASAETKMQEMEQTVLKLNKKVEEDAKEQAEQLERLKAENEELLSKLKQCPMNPESDGENSSSSLMVADSSQNFCAVPPECAKEKCKKAREELETLKWQMYLQYRVLCYSRVAYKPSSGRTEVGWLSSSIVDDYMVIILKQQGVIAEKVTLVETRRADAIFKNWKEARMMDIQEFMVLPVWIDEGSPHWSLLILWIKLENPGKPYNVKSYYFDSLQGPEPQNYTLVAVTYWKKCLVKSVERVSDVKTTRTYAAKRIKLPKQGNSWDCGVWMLYYLKAFLNASNKEEFLTQRDFTNSSIEGFRTELYDLLLVPR